MERLIVFFIFEELKISTIIAKTEAVRSAKGKEYHTPFMPKNLGKINRAGIKHKTCRDKDKKMEILGLPTAWKKFDATT